jgi:hypothetical protein
MRGSFGGKQGNLARVFEGKQARCEAAPDHELSIQANVNLGAWQERMRNSKR